MKPRPFSLVALCAAGVAIWTALFLWSFHKGAWAFAAIFGALVYKDVELFRLKPWARRWGVVLGWMGIAGGVPLLAISLLTVIGMRQEVPPRGALSLEIAVAAISLALWPLLALAVGAVAVLNRADVKTAFGKHSSEIK